jgi:ABC-2 type transport system ATP-binding protein
VRSPAIEVIELKKSFGKVVAVDGLTFAVPRCQVCALLGPNGAGKTTTIQMLLGLTLPTSGSVRLLGFDAERERTEAISRTNFMASYVAFPWRLRVGEMLRVYAELYEVERPREAVAEVIDLFGIAPLRGRLCQMLSSGQQTLVGLAKALLNRPRLLVLDEPTASLDPDHADQVRRVLQRVAKEWEMTIFITSHNMPEVERLADRVLFLSKGRLLADASPSDLRTEFAAADLEQVFLHVAREGREP